MMRQTQRVPWRPGESQAALAKQGVAAIVVPSYASGATEADINVVFWHWSAAPPHQARVIDDEHRSPRDGRSWR